MFSLISGLAHLFWRCTGEAPMFFLQLATDNTLLPNAKWASIQITRATENKYYQSSFASDAIVTEMPAHGYTCTLV